MSLLSLITGRQHHYFVRFRYRPIQNSDAQYCDQTMVIWIRDQRLIADHREIKKACWDINNIPWHLRKNGSLNIEQIHYLGWFKPKEAQS